MPNTADSEMDLQVKRRRELSTKLREILGSNNVYFQPPANTKMKFPCFVYNRSNPYKLQANDKTYLRVGHYSVTYIDPDVEACMAMMTKMLESFQHISVERSFTSENLNHDVYNLYF